MGFITLTQSTELSGAYSLRYSLNESHDYKIVIFLFGYIISRETE